MKALIVGTVLALVIAAAGMWWLGTPTPVRSVSPSGLVSVSEAFPQEQQWRQDFTFADMNGDGVADLITAPPRKGKEPRPYIFLRHGDGWQQACTDKTWGGFPDKQEYSYGGVAVADFDTDGKLEIAIAMHETGIRVFTTQQATPCGPWTERQDLLPDMMRMRTRAIAAADLNRDGRPDIVALSEAPPPDADSAIPGIVIFWNEQTGWRSQALAGSEGLFGDDVAIGEVNGDGTPDIAVGSLDDQRPQFAWLSDGAGGWKAVSEGFPPNIIAWSAQLIDIDNDKRDELVLGVGSAPIYENGGPRIYRWDGARWNSLSQGLPQVSWVCGVTAADLDGDGNKEIIAAGMYTGGVQVYRRQTDGVWTERQSITIPDSEGLRNYKVRAVAGQPHEQHAVVANYAGEDRGKILVWMWR